MAVAAATGGRDGLRGDAGGETRRAGATCGIPLVCVRVEAADEDWGGVGVLWAGRACARIVAKAQEGAHEVVGCGGDWLHLQRVRAALTVVDSAYSSPVKIVVPLRSALLC